jgi:hypothetical protein
MASSSSSDLPVLSASDLSSGASSSHHPRYAAVVEHGPKGVVTIIPSASESDEEVKARLAASKVEFDAAHAASRARRAAALAAKGPSRFKRQDVVQEREMQFLNTVFGILIKRIPHIPSHSVWIP